MSNEAGAVIYAGTVIALAIIAAAHIIGAYLSEKD